MTVTISAFADEINPSMQQQIAGLIEQKIKHIELRTLDGKNVSELTFEEAHRYKQQLDTAGITVSSIGSPIGKININDPFSEHLELFKHVLHLANIFQSPYVRMFSFFIDPAENPDDYQEEVVTRWKAFIAIAKAYPEITLLHENEKEIFGDTPERCAYLLNELNNPQVKAVFDPANFVQCDVEAFPDAYELLKPSIAYLHIKDARFSDHEVRPAGFGDGKLEEILNDLTSNGYNGFVSLEPHLTFFEGFERLEPTNQQLTKKADNARMFILASESLKKLLTKLDVRWQ
ncbi:sugar phosphate isomerase/epimerase family protein [Enterococcus thailandicus]|uniref:Xylose isomerase-like TIM barrel domain-containing protein n=1 Tax=Enterococcus thailandicus TaxID=417368 RepID=A0A510WAL8_ENTTH|nr:TIM barrel protein [Enterococcus thailandicus]OJG95902.1 hypothetical protein RV17_GL001085 [Enterococcus thailandicus]GEK36263.1 hypothetical protein ETH01_05500 [Enterococcus thailandicus]